tara:strand:- start:235895 stop:237862 length:1968 start_codon:yes stop_codon:yes gene_type:complete
MLKKYFAIVLLLVLASCSYATPIVSCSRSSAEGTSIPSATSLNQTYSQTFTCTLNVTQAAPQIVYINGAPSTVTFPAGNSCVVYNSTSEATKSCTITGQFTPIVESTQTFNFSYNTGGSEYPFAAFSTTVGNAVPFTCERSTTVGSTIPAETSVGTSYAQTYTCTLTHAIAGVLTLSGTYPSSYTWTTNSCSLSGVGDACTLAATFTPISDNVGSQEFAINGSIDDKAYDDILSYSTTVSESTATAPTIVFAGALYEHPEEPGGEVIPGALYSNTYEDGSWDGWEALTAPGIFPDSYSLQSIATAKVGDNYDVFVAMTDEGSTNARVFRREYNTSTQTWGDWTSMLDDPGFGPSLDVAKLVAIRHTNGDVELFASVRGGGLKEKIYTASSGWSDDWEEVAGLDNSHFVSFLQPVSLADGEIQLLIGGQVSPAGNFAELLTRSNSAWSESSYASGLDGDAPILRGDSASYTVGDTTYVMALSEDDLSDPMAYRLNVTSVNTDTGVWSGSWNQSGGQTGVLPLGFTERGANAVYAVTTPADTVKLFLGADIADDPYNNSVYSIDYTDPMLLWAPDTTTDSGSLPQQSSIVLQSVTQTDSTVDLFTALDANHENNGGIYMKTYSSSWGNWQLSSVTPTSMGEKNWSSMAAISPALDDN